MNVQTMLMDQIDNAGLLFNVRESAVFTDSGEIFGKKAIINAQTNQAMGIVSNRYKVVSNQEIFENFTAGIAASGIDATEAKVKIVSTPTKSRSIVDFIFPAETIQVGGDDSKTALSITALNSYDGTTRYTTKAGGLRMKCLNGQILGKVVGSYSATHTDSLDVKESASRVIGMITEFNNAKDYFNTLMSRNVDPSVQMRVMCEFLKLDASSEFEKNKRFVKLQDLVTQYQREMGPSAYSLYNALTDFVTHNSSRSAESAAINQANHRRRLEKLINSNAVFA